MLYITRKHKYVDAGVFGKYYLLNAQTGIKIYKAGLMSRRDADCEFSVLWALYLEGLAPRPYALVEVLYEDTITVGIIMEHIPRALTPDVWDANRQIKTRLKDAYRKYGVVVVDGHDGNYRVKDNGDIVRIDCGGYTLRDWCRSQKHWERELYRALESPFD